MKVNWAIHLNINKKYAYFIGSDFRPLIVIVIINILLLLIKLDHSQSLWWEASVTLYEDVIGCRRRWRFTLSTENLFMLIIKSSVPFRVQREAQRGNGYINTWSGLVWKLSLVNGREDPALINVCLLKEPELLRLEFQRPSDTTDNRHACEPVLNTPVH